MNNIIQDGTNFWRREWFSNAKCQSSESCVYELLDDNYNESKISIVDRFQINYWKGSLVLGSRIEVIVQKSAFRSNSN